ncbi:vacuolar iron transporter homolog 2-like [Chenopodium quinoa]|nr:vacuolar iron transporter homolog 2-like [Chenopodium quinoa]
MHPSLATYLYMHLINYSLSFFFLLYFIIMATKQIPFPPTKLEIIRPTIDEESQKQGDENKNNDMDYSKRSQWLRAAVLGANDGLVSTASLMLGVGAVKQDVKAMILTGFAGLVAGACSMAIGEFVSVYSQLDIEVAQMKREKVKEGEKEEEEERLPNPLQAAFASALAFSLGALVPLLAASFIKDYKVRLVVVVVAVTAALAMFGWLGAFLGRAPLVRASIRVLLGGWLAMAITFGLTKLIGSFGL